MLNKGYSNDCFVMMHLRAGFKTSAKGVVCPFSTPRYPVRRSFTGDR